MARATFCVSVVALLLAAPVAAQMPDEEAGTPLPVRRVVLYKAGIGYFEHVGQVHGDRSLSIRFTSAQLDDALKTLTVLDLDGGRVVDIGYNSLAPLGQRLRNLRLPLGVEPTLFDFLKAVRGARVEVRTGSEAATGRLLSAERRTRSEAGQARDTEQVSVVTDGGEVRRFELGPEVAVRLLEADLRREVGRYLELLASARDEDVRRLTISTQGSGQRSIFVSYVSEVPIWKSSYRLVLPTEPDQRPILQGWAIVDNTVGEDWNDVELSLVGGAPQSFIQRISQPYYARRPVVPLPEHAALVPQTHAATLTAGSGRIVGEVRDGDGTTLPGVTVTALGPDGRTIARDVTDANGDYALGPVPAGTYELRFEIEGFARQTSITRVQGGREVRRDVTLALSAVEETVTVRRRSPPADARSTTVRRYQPPAAAPEPEPMESRVDRGLRALEAAAQGQELGDLFEYRISDPVTIRTNESALVPILRAEVAVEKVSLWNRGPGSGRPLRAVWLTNSSGLSLDGGSFVVLEDGTFAGEGLLESMKPGERRLLSYGATASGSPSSRSPRRR